LTMAMAASSLVVAQQAAPRVFVPESHTRQAAQFGDLRLLPVRDDVWVVMGPGGNSTVQAGGDGTVVVDTGLEEQARDLVDAIRSVSARPVRQIINTHVHDDHTGGNEVVARAGRFIGAANARPAVTFLGSAAGASILAYETTVRRMSAADRQPAIPPGRWPTETFFVDRKDLYLNGESIQVLHRPAAHSDSDAAVYFRRSDVIAAGDVYTPDRFPVIDLEQGGSITGVLAGINALLDLAVPDFNEEGGTLIVPGHGRIGDESDVSDYRDMVTIVRDRVADMVSRSATLDQVKAAKPTLDYDGVYATPSYTGDMFVEAIYRSLTPSAARRPGGFR
jgi:cyclase